METDHLRATLLAYDTVAENYEAAMRDDLDRSPVDRAVLALFAELAGGTVADLGCGPGRLTAHLHGLGLETAGYDLSPRMVDLARRLHPGLRFEVGTLDRIDVPDGALGGAVAWLAIIHLPDAELPGVFTEIRRALRPGAPVVLSFQEGDRIRHIERGYGHDVSLDLHYRSAGRVSALLRDAELDVVVTVRREPEPGERDPQAYLIARRR